MINYVAGFMFSKDGRYVAMVHKEKPEWQKGKLNAVGGKIEDGEDPYEAMAREFKEETGVETQPTDWSLFVDLKHESKNGQVKFFYYYDDKVFNIKTKEKERIVAMHLYEVMDAPNVMENIKWLIPLALTKNVLQLPIEIVDKD